MSQTIRVRNGDAGAHRSGCIARTKFYSKKFKRGIKNDFFGIQEITYYFYFVIRNQKAVEVSGDAFAQR